MRQDESYPAPFSDPATSGIPDYAEDDSSAYDDVDSPRESYGTNTWAVPPDRDDGPLGLDDVATTPEGDLRVERGARLMPSRGFGIE